MPKIHLVAIIAIGLSTILAANLAAEEAKKETNDSPDPTSFTIDSVKILEAIKSSLKDHDNGFKLKELVDNHKDVVQSLATWQGQTIAAGEMKAKILEKTPSVRALLSDQPAGTGIAMFVDIYIGPIDNQLVASPYTRLGELSNSAYGSMVNYYTNTERFGALDGPPPNGLLRSDEHSGYIYFFKSNNGSLKYQTYAGIHAQAARNKAYADARRGYRPRNTSEFPSPLAEDMLPISFSQAWKSSPEQKSNITDKSDTQHNNVDASTYNTRANGNQNYSQSKPQAGHNADASAASSNELKDFYDNFRFAPRGGADGSENKPDAPIAPAPPPPPKADNSPPKPDNAPPKKDDESGRCKSEGGVCIKLNLGKPMIDRDPKVPKEVMDDLTDAVRTGNLRLVLAIFKFIDINTPPPGPLERRRSPNVELFSPQSPRVWRQSINALKDNGFARDRLLDMGKK